MAKNASTALLRPVERSEGHRVDELGDNKRRWRLRRSGRYFALIGLIACVIVAWQVSGLYLNPIFISTPSKVATSLWSLIKGGQLEKELFSTLWELLLGFMLGVAIGFIIGVAMGCIRPLEQALNPAVNFLNSTPLIAVLPLIIIWFGLGPLSRIVYMGVLGTPPMLINTLAGMRTVQKGYRDVGQAFGLEGWRAIGSVYIPASLPFMFVGARVALGHVLLGAIISGQEIGQSGLGGMLQSFGQFAETADLVATIVVTSALALLLFWVLRRMESRFCPWIGDTAGTRS